MRGIYDFLRLVGSTKRATKHSVTKQRAKRDARRPMIKNSRKRNR